MSVYVSKVPNYLKAELVRFFNFFSYDHCWAEIRTHQDNDRMCYVLNKSFEKRMVKRPKTTLKESDGRLKVIQTYFLIIKNFAE